MEIFKLYLFDRYAIETVGSKTVIKECFDKKLINEEKLKKLLEIVEIRNNTSAVYKEDFAYDVAEQIQSHYPAMKNYLI